MSWATNWPKNGQPAATARRARGLAAVAGAAGGAERVQQALVGRERRQVGEHPPVAAAPRIGASTPLRGQAVVARASVAHDAASARGTCLGAGLGRREQLPACLHAHRVVAEST